MSAGAHSGYDLFAEIYNRWMAEDFCRRALPVIERLLLARLSAGAPLLDLCCGSGQMARALTERGFRVTGLDASEKMLRFARDNAPAAEFIVADARGFAVSRKFAACLSTFNSLAHAQTVSELELVFRCVRAALAKGAPLLFDLSTEEAYTSRWRGSFGLVADEHACIVRPSYDAERRTGRNDVTMFRRNEIEMPRFAIHETPHPTLCGQWTRSDFCIEQKCHSTDDVRGALDRAGFHHVDTYDAQRNLGMAEECGRMFFRCS